MLGTPLTGRMPRGREALLQDLLQHARKPSARRRHLLLAAPRKAGRTSVLAAFAHALRSRQTRVAWIDARQASVPALTAQVLWGLARAARPRTARPPAETPDFPGLVQSFPKRLRAVGRNLQDLWHRRIEPGAELETLAEALRLADPLQRALRGPLWLLVDSFERGVALLGETFLAGPFRDVLARNRQTRWALAGAPPSLMERLSQGRRAPLAGLVERFCFRGLAYQESLRLLQEHPGAARLTPAHQTFLVAFTGGHPYYLALLGHALDRAAQDLGRRAAPSRLLLEALTRSLCDPAGRLHLTCQTLLLEAFWGWRAPELYQGLLEAVAQGQGSLAGMAAAIRRDAPALSRQVQNLLDSGLVAKEGTRYFIPDPLFRSWLRHVYFTPPSPEAPAPEAFQQRFRELLDDFLGSLEAETTRRIARLLAASDGKAPLPAPLPGAGSEPALETLPRFDQVELQQKVGGETFHLVARRGNEYWAFEVAEVSPPEAALTAFAERLDRARAARPPDQRLRPFLIALSSLSRAAARAARRLALELWTREDLNRLAECYGQLPLLGGAASGRRGPAGR